MNEKNKDRYTKNQSYNRQKDRTAMINAASADTFGFDCVCLIKGLLWGWNGDTSKTYGGAKYDIKTVPDIGADSMIKKCKDVSTDFSKIQVGEAVWMPGHIGLYIGDGLAVECTPIWKDGVQVTAVENIGRKKGYNSRNWEKHGKLPWVTYAETPQVTYQVYADGRWLPAVTGCDDYAGIFGQPISGVRVEMSDGQGVIVRVHTCSGWDGDTIDCLAMKVAKCQVKYRVHIKDGKWLPWVTGCDINNYAHGLAGVYGKPIDAVQIDVVE